MKWRKLGLIVKPDVSVEWLATHAGPSFALVNDNAETSISIYVTGRDGKNRSRIGLIEFNMDKLSIQKVHSKPVLSLGDRGTFDENGTGYPCLVRHQQTLFMYYVGWIPSVLVPFHNDMGLATSTDGLHFERVSKAPLFPANAEEYLGTGSMYVMKTKDTWRMWYTCFHRWGTGADEAKHHYDIKYAESSDGITWYRPNTVAITFKDSSEYAIGRPSVVYHMGRYHMWYVYRGYRYKIGYAISNDGITWTRCDEQVGLECSSQGWDSEMLCYPNCFFWKNQLYMLYNGNGYGETGVGLAVLEDWA